MAFENFLKKFNVNVVTVAASDLTICSMVRKNVFGVVKEVEPFTIVDVLHKHKIVDASAHGAVKNSISSLPKEPAQFLDVKLDVVVDHESDLEVPGVGDFSNTFKLDKKISYEFTDVTAKVISSELRLELSSLLDDFREKKLKEYRQELRRFHFVERLFYGNLVISIEKDLEANLQAELKAKNLKIQSRTELERTVQIKTNTSDLPFAMELEKARGL